MYLVNKNFANNSINASKGKIIDIKNKKLASSLIEAGYIVPVSEKEISNKEKEKQIAELNNQIIEKDVEISNLNDKITKLEQENQELKEKLNDVSKTSPEENLDNDTVNQNEDDKNLDNDNLNKNENPDISGNKE